MNDSLDLLIGMLVCTVPPALVIGLIVWAVRASGGRGREERARIDQLEYALHALRGENATLLQRVSRLEASMAAVQRAQSSQEAMSAGEALASKVPARGEERRLVESATAVLAPHTTAPEPSPIEQGAPASALASVPVDAGGAPVSTATPALGPAAAGAIASSAAPISSPASEAMTSSHDSLAAAAMQTASITRGPVSTGAAIASSEGPVIGGAAALGEVSVEAGGSGSIGAPSTMEPASTSSPIGAPSSATSAPSMAAPASASNPPSTTAAASAGAAPSSAQPPSGAPPFGPGGGAGVPPRRPPPASDGGWERWIGVRGAAALGACILVIAGIYFFEYSIEHGLITPAMRMIAGTIVGLGCVLASELRLRKTHVALADWLGGAGVAILYVAFWAGRALYELYPTWAAGVLMVAVTAACVTLALRRDSAPIAVLGLLGGFITPLALSTGTDRPIPLFGYILLLDGAMLWVAYKRRWGWMALLCLVATALYQNAWLMARLDQPRMILGVSIVSVFAILFAALPRRGASEEAAKEDAIWRFTRSAGVILPLLFSVPLAARSDLGDTFWPTAMELVLLCVAAAWVGARHRSAILPSGAALLAIGAVLGWALGHEADTADEVWKVCGLALVLALVFHVFAEVERRRGRDASAPSIVSVLSLLAIALLAAPLVHSAGLWPWLVLWVGLSAIGIRLGSFEGREALQLAVAALASLGLGATFAAGAGDSTMPGAPLFLGILAIAAVAMQLAGLLPRGDRARCFGDHAAVIFALVLVPLIAMVLREREVPLWSFYGATILLAMLALFAASRVRAAGWMPLALLAMVFSHGLWVARRYEGPFTLLELGALGVAVFAMTLWPIVAPRTTRESAWAWRTAALAGPLYLLVLRHVYLDVLGPKTIGALPLVLALSSIGAATAVRSRGPDGADARRVALVWLTATAAGFVTLAIPMQLAQEWITLGWALEALVLLGLWRRFDHTGLKYLAFALAAVVCVRLVANPYVLGYYERSPIRIFNWLSYTYLVPAAALLGMWWFLREHEIPRRRSWEQPFFPKKHALMANLAASAAILVLFVWVNLTIVDWFATGPELAIPTERLPARDLTISIAWAVFALSLLGLGLWRRSTGLRVTSLALVLITAGKVFLYDLAHLHDLYRVASLVGLALSLIVISLVYQRFVFRTERAPEATR